MNKYQEALNIFCEQNTFKDISKDVLNENYKLLQELVNKSTTKWIPVEERLPELNTKVLVTWRTYHSGNHYIDILYRDEYGRWGCGVELTSGCVVAWMPLPEAYGGKR